MLRNPVWICLLLAGTLACGGPDEGGEAPVETPDPTGAWRLATFGGEPAAEPSRITVVLTEEGKLSGFGGCNRYFSSYETSDGATLSVARLGATRSACAEELMDLERRFFTALESARTFRVGDGSLEILDGGGTVVMTFTADPSAAS